MSCSSRHLGQFLLCVGRSRRPHTTPSRKTVQKKRCMASVYVCDDVWEGGAEYGDADVGNDDWSGNVVRSERVSALQAIDLSICVSNRVNALVRA